MLHSLQHILQVLLAHCSSHEVGCQFSTPFGTVVDGVDGLHVCQSRLKRYVGDPVLSAEGEERWVDVQMLYAEPAVCVGEVCQPAGR